MLEKWLEGVGSSNEEVDEESENVVVKKVFLNKLKIEEGIKFAQQDNSVEIIIPREVHPSKIFFCVFFRFFNYKLMFFRNFKNVTF